MADIKDTLKKLAEQIRDERNAGANTALRVGSLLLAIFHKLMLYHRQFTAAHCHILRNIIVQ